MSRRKFIQAYNDIVNRKIGQSTSEINRISEAHGRNSQLAKNTELSRKGLTEKCAKEEILYDCRYVSNPKLTYKSPPRQKDKSEDTEENELKQVDKKQFVEIDGEELPPIDQVKEKTAHIPTFYKIQNHMSLMDLNVDSSKRDAKGESQSTVDNLQSSRDEIKQVPSSTELRAVLPRGFEGWDEPYVIPKFTPTFREMLAGKAKQDTLVSILEPTPPSLQKWALDWNSDPKHTISITELKEDIDREKSENCNGEVYQLSDGNNPILPENGYPATAYKKRRHPGRNKRGQYSKSVPQDTQKGGLYIVENEPIETTSYKPDSLDCYSIGGLISKSSGTFQQNAPDGLAQNKMSISNSNIASQDHPLVQTQKRTTLPIHYKFINKTNKFSFKNTLQLDPTKDRQISNETDDDCQNFHSWFKTKLAHAARNMAKYKYNSYKTTPQKTSISSNANNSGGCSLHVHHETSFRDTNESNVTRQTNLLPAVPYATVPYNYWAKNKCQVVPKLCSDSSEFKIVDKPKFSWSRQYKTVEKENQQKPSHSSRIDMIGKKIKSNDSISLKPPSMSKLSRSCNDLFSRQRNFRVNQTKENVQMATTENESMNSRGIPLHLSTPVRTEGDHIKNLRYTDLKLPKCESPSIPPCPKWKKSILYLSDRKPSNSSTTVHDISSNYQRSYTHIPNDTEKSDYIFDNRNHLNFHDPKPIDMSEIPLKRDLEYLKQTETLIEIEPETSMHNEEFAEMEDIEAESNDLDEQWTSVIGPKRQNFDADRDFLRLVGKEQPEPKKSLSVVWSR